MTDIDPGIREAFYLAGLNFANQPAKIVPREDRAEDHERLSDGTNQIDRALWGSGLAAIPIIRAWSLVWDAIQPADNDLIKLLRATPGSYPFTFWDRVAETFVSDGTTTVYYLAGAQASVVVPTAQCPGGSTAAAVAKHPTVVRTGASLGALSVITTGFTMGVAADTRGRQTITLDAPLAALTLLAVTYPAAWRCNVVIPASSYPGQFLESVSMELEVV